MVKGSEDARAEVLARELLAARPMKLRELVDFITIGREPPISEEAAKSAIIRLLKIGAVTQDGSTGYIRFCP
jgi:hypothetical protein